MKYFLRTFLVASALCVAPAPLAQNYPSPTLKDGTLISSIGKSGKSVVTPSGKLALSPVYEVGAYGVVGDNGITDNATSMSTLTSAIATSAQGGRIDLPCGKFKFSTAIAITIPAGKHLSINGQGCTELYFPASDGLVLTYGSNSSYVSIDNLAITTGGASASYTAIWLKSSVVNIPQNAKQSSIRRVSIHGSDGMGATNYWGKGIFQDKVSFVNIDDYTYNGSSTLQGDGILMQGDVSAPEFNVVTNITNSNFAYCQTGVKYGTYYQGLSFAGNNITGCNRGIYSPVGNLLNLQASITGNQFSNVTSSIEFASEMGDAQITGNTFLLNGPSSFAIKTAGLVNSTISGNSFNPAFTAGNGNAISIGSGGNAAEAVTIVGNSCLSTATCISIASGAKGIAANNIWWNVTSPYQNLSSTFFQHGNIQNGAQFVSQAGSLSEITVADNMRAGNLLASRTSPTIGSGFCTSPAIVVPNGTFSFRVSVGTSCAASSGIITMPTAANGWSCQVTSGLNVGTSDPAQDLTGSTASQITIRNYSRTTGAAANFTSSDVLLVNCLAQ